jgi:hypothetical protein
MSFLTDVLTVGGVHQDDIDRLEQVLATHASELHAGRPEEPTVALFGGSPAGQDLDLQTSRAYDHVRKAIDELVVGLTAYGDNIKQFARDFDVTDTTIGVDLSSRTQVIQSIESCTTPNDFHNTNTCAPPTTGGSDD